MRVESNQPIIKHPLLRYFGGKFRLAPWIISHFPKHDIYVEPFGGAGSVLLKKERIGCEVYNDIDYSVFNLFEVLRDPTKSQLLIEQIKLTPFHRQEYLNACNYGHDNDVELARQLVIRSFMSFSSNGCHQKNSGFSCSTKKGKTTDASTWQKLPGNLMSIVERLQGVVIENLPALEIINKHDSKNTLFYLDPPYLHDTRQSIKSYQYEMTFIDHETLLKAINKINGKAVISGYDSDLYNDLLQGWIKKKIQTRAAAQRGTAVRTECIWIKN